MQSKHSAKNQKLETEEAREIRIAKYYVALKSARALVKKYAKGKDLLAELHRIRKLDDKDFV